MKSIRTKIVALIGFGALVLMADLIAPKAARAVASILVEVTNTPSNPVPNQDVDQPGRNPYMHQCLWTPGTGCAIVAPDRQRVVVQYVSARIDAKACQEIHLYLDGGQSATIPCVLVAGAGSPGTFLSDSAWIAQGPLTFYFEPGNPLFIEVVGGDRASVLISGYTVALPMIPDLGGPGR